MNYHLDCRSLSHSCFLFSTATRMNLSANITDATRSRVLLCHLLRHILLSGGVYLYNNTPAVLDTTRSLVLCTRSSATDQRFQESFHSRQSCTGTHPSSIGSDDRYTRPSQPPSAEETSKTRQDLLLEYLSCRNVWPVPLLVCCCAMSFLSERSGWVAGIMRAISPSRYTLSLALIMSVMSATTHGFGMLC